MTINQTDKAVFVACATTFLTFLINARIGSIWLLYLNVFLTVGVFSYAIRRWDEYSHLSSSTVFGVVASIAYTPLDWLFSRKAFLISYLRPDIPWMPAVPLCLLLTWMIAIAVIVYLYQRLNSIWGRSYISAGIIGVVAFIGSIAFDQLGSTRLWNWNETPLGGFPRIGSIPASVPIALAVTFLLTPYYFHRHSVVVGAIRCGLFIGIMQFLCFMLFYFVRQG